MSSIAYITDSTMLENHRLLRNKTMNFWRLSTNINFSDFGIGDLVFFLSKDRVHRRKGEKGIIGFGRLKELRVYSPSTMWRKYGKDTELPDGSEPGLRQTKQTGAGSDQRSNPQYAGAWISPADRGQIRAAETDRKV